MVEVEEMLETHTGNFWPDLARDLTQATDFFLQKVANFGREMRPFFLISGKSRLVKYDHLAR